MAEEIPEIEEITVDDLDFPPVEPAAETLMPLEESTIDFEPPPEMDFVFPGRRRSIFSGPGRSRFTVVR